MPNVFPLDLTPFRKVFISREADRVALKFCLLMECQKNMELYPCQGYHINIPS